MGQDSSPGTFFVQFVDDLIELRRDSGTVSRQASKRGQIALCLVDASRTHKPSGRFVGEEGKPDDESHVDTGSKEDDLILQLADSNVKGDAVDANGGQEKAQEQHHTEPDCDEATNLRGGNLNETERTSDGVSTNAKSRDDSSDVQCGERAIAESRNDLSNDPNGCVETH